MERLADDFAAAALMPAGALERFGAWSDLAGEELAARPNAAADELHVTSSALRRRLAALGEMGIVIARNWRFGPTASYWTGAKRRSGLVRFIGTTPGCCAGRTRPASVPGSGWGSANGLCRWSASLMMWGIGRGRPCERRIRGDGWTECSASSLERRGRRLNVAEEIENGPRTR